MRKFDIYTEEQKFQALVLAFAMAVTLPKEKREGHEIYTLAAAQGKISGLRPSDFEKIKSLTIADLALLT